MTSIYSSISIELELVTLISVYKTINYFLLEWNFTCFKERFSLFDSSKYYQILQKFELFTVIYQVNLQQLFLLFVVRKKGQKCCSIYLLKQSSLQTVFKLFFLGFKIFPEARKRLQGHRSFLNCLVLKFPHFQSRQSNFLLYSYSKGLINWFNKLVQQLV